LELGIRVGRGSPADLLFREAQEERGPGPGVIRIHILGGIPAVGALCELVDAEPEMTAMYVGCHNCL